jgi:1-acyl-sn-glycerol-3-phosphate acyltransferase
VSIVKTILGFAYTVFSAFAFMLFGFPAFLLSFLGFKKPMALVINRLAHLWAIGIIFITGCKPVVEGRKNIPKRGSVCFVSNHVGVFDIILALAYINRPFGFIAKKELSSIPFFGMWIYILGGLFIDRKNIRKALKTINHGIQKIKDGNGMLIFPEGTRSKGRGLLPFKSGAIKLATHSLAPIVPIAITGSYEVFEKDYRVHVAPVRMVFRPVIITAEMSPDERRHGLVDQVRLSIESGLGLRITAPDPSQLE